MRRRMRRRRWRKPRSNWPLLHPRSGFRPAGDHIFKASMREGEEAPDGDGRGRRGEKGERQGDFDQERKELAFADDMDAFDMPDAPTISIRRDGAPAGFINQKTETRHGLISHIRPGAVRFCLEKRQRSAADGWASSRVPSHMGSALIGSLSFPALAKRAIGITTVIARRRSRRSNPAPHRCSGLLRFARNDGL